jgi:hypothetical protein
MKSMLVAVALVFVGAQANAFNFPMPEVENIPQTEVYVCKAGTQPDGVTADWSGLVTISLKEEKLWMSEEDGLVGVPSKISNVERMRCLHTARFDVSLLGAAVPDKGHLQGCGMSGGITFTLSNQDALETVVFDCEYKQ